MRHVFLLCAACCCCAYLVVVVQDLLEQFDLFGGGTGTRLVLWGLKKDLHLRGGDVVVNAPDGAPPHEARLLPSYFHSFTVHS